jgi:hypothetical protein
VEDHPVLQWDRPELARKEKGLRLFGQLVMNKVLSDTPDIRLAG